jgi:hypothetical protein
VLAAASHWNDSGSLEQLTEILVVQPLPVFRITREATPFIRRFEAKPPVAILAEIILGGSSGMY